MDVQKTLWPLTCLWFNHTTLQHYMKHILFLVVLFVGMEQLSAQCSITPSCTLTGGGYCSDPAYGNNLPNATEQVSYNSTIQISVASSFSNVIVDSMEVISVAGLPLGLSYSINPTSGIIHGGSNGCILIAGTPAAGSAGTYTVMANMNAYVNVTPNPVPGTVIWNLTVSTPAGIANVTANTANLVIAPNPAGSEINLTANFHFQKVGIFDALGNLILLQDGNSAYQARIDISKLTAGFYFAKICDEDKIIIRKFFKE